MVIILSQTYTYTYDNVLLLNIENVIKHLGEILF